MPYYLFQWKYTDPAVKAMIETPQDRPAELRKAVEAFGGRMHQFFFAFGEFDGVSIVEFLPRYSSVGRVLLSHSGCKQYPSFGPQRRPQHLASGSSS